MEIRIQEHPLVTFVIFAYNQQRFVREAIDAALAQTYSPLEILLSDDCSTDDTFGIMQQMASEYRGPHKIVLNRNDPNLGIGGHVAKVFAMMNGSYGIFSAGDDVSEADRTSAVMEAFLADPSRKAVFSDVASIAEDGLMKEKHTRCWNAYGDPNLFDLARIGGGVGCGASYAYARQVGTWPSRFPETIQNEDRLLPWRAALLGSIGYIPKPLVRYRQTSNGLCRSTPLLELVAINKASHLAELEKTLAVAVSERRISDHSARQAMNLVHLGRRLLNWRHAASRNGTGPYSSTLRLLDQAMRLWHYRHMTGKVVKRALGSIPAFWK